MGRHHDALAIPSGTTMTTCSWPLTCILSQGVFRDAVSLSVVYSGLVLFELNQCMSLSEVTSLQNPRLYIFPPISPTFPEQF